MNRDRETAEQKLISVVVCTYNRAAILEGCLQSLISQSADPTLFEVLVVDNNSSDDTAEVVARFAQHEVPVRRVLEPAQGLSFCRNTGWRLAEGSYVAYVDDDARACPDWIATAVDFIARRPEVGIFGGPYDPFYLVPKPAWFPSEYGRLNLGTTERAVRLGEEWLTGSNLIVKKSLLGRFGGFNERLGMKGNGPAYGEEIHFLLAMHEQGVPVHYVPALTVTHLVADYKMRLPWQFRSGYAAGRDHHLIFGRKGSVAGLLFTLLLCLVKACCRLATLSRVPLKQRLYLGIKPACYIAGELAAHWGNSAAKRSH